MCIVWTIIHKTDIVSDYKLFKHTLSSHIYPFSLICFVLVGFSSPKTSPLLILKNVSVNWA